MLQQILLMTFPVAMAFAAANDLFTMRIPNKISIFLVSAFALAAAAVGMSLETVATHAGVAGAVLVITFLLFSFNMLGGGDAKLMAAGALWMGVEHVVEFVAVLTVFGGILAVVILFYRKFIPIAVFSLPGWAVRLHEKDSGIPYGIAIAAAGLVFYPSTELFRVLSGH